MNRFLPTTLHGVLHYIVAITLITSPWTFGFYGNHGGSLFVPMYFGILQLIMGFFTNYEFGVIKAVPVELHFVLDIVSGFIIMMSPFMYDFGANATNVNVFWPHFLLGLYTLLSGVFTVIKPHLSDAKFSATA